MKIINKIKDKVTVIKKEKEAKEQREREFWREMRQYCRPNIAPKK